MQALIVYCVREIIIGVHEVEIIHWDTLYQCTELSKGMIPSPMKENI